MASKRITIILLSDKARKPRQIRIPKSLLVILSLLVLSAMALSAWVLKDYQSIRLKIPKLAQLTKENNEKKRHLIALSQREFAIIVNQPTCYLGKISFNAYLVHFAVLYWMTRLDRIHFIAVDTALDVLINFGIRFAVVASVTVLISSLSYLLVEERFILLGKRMIARLS